ncbi:hypothetical protein [Colwellia psychrerythraea]|uniref:SPOR domain-containing protein n=1 Tax=Colwellia psychrerythraea (strain 34H / ATCC BAA-681) TaxID=167879 RepID=Q482A5_COLP3|nr:hypothetical protein [Colwellia psychrerythraea]AAZ27756.1 hypothetical protein CPS_2396 [Colwellia psychrerythraea 34H]
MKWNYLFSSIALTLFSSAHAMDCEPVPQYEQIKPSDNRCIEAASSRMKSANYQVDLSLLRLDLLIEHDPSNQDIVLTHIYHDYCQIVDASVPLLTEPDQIEHLEKAKLTLFDKIEDFDIAFDTRKEVLVRNIEVQPPKVLVAWVNGPQSLFQVDGGGQKEPSAGAEFSQLPLLQDPPYIITNSRKYFTIVYSTPDFAEAKRKAKRLKRKFPELDFVVYDKYPDNANYGIMMATWTSKEIANRAAKFAKEHIRNDSFVWHCRGTDGMTC